MIDPSVQGFFTKNASEDYSKNYDRDHGPRLDAMIAKWNLRESLAGKRVVDIGGGLGFLGKRLDPTTDYWVIDGAEIAKEQRLCDGAWLKTDLDHNRFGADWVPFDLGKTDNLSYAEYGYMPIPRFDAAFCLETLEHLTNPYHCLAEIKKLVKPDGDVFISIPHANVWHNYIYPALMVDPNAFAQFLGQMALPIVDYWLWDKGWNAHCFKCRNAAWHEKVMLYPKSAAKFVNATPVEMVNW